MTDTSLIPPPIRRKKDFAPRTHTHTMPESAPKVTPFPTFSPSEFLDYDTSGETPILSDGKNDPWMRGSLATLVGGCGIGKSRFALHLAFHDVLRRPFAGFQTHGAGRWLLMSPESSPGRLRRDLSPLLADTTLSEIDRETLNNNLKIAPFVRGADSPPTQLDSPAAVSALRLLSSEYKPDVVVVDPWEAFIKGGDVNDAAETRNSRDALQNIFHDSTLLIVHHSREGAEAVKSATGFNATAFTKGSKTLTTMARFQINLTALHPPTESAEQGHGIVVNCGKVSDSRGFKSRALEFNDDTGVYEVDADFNAAAYRLNVDGKRGNKAVPMRAVIDAVRSGATTPRDVREAIAKNGSEASPASVKRALNEARDAGALKNPRHGTYEIGPKADSLAPVIPTTQK